MLEIENTYPTAFHALINRLKIDSELSIAASRAIARPDLFYRSFSIPKRSGGLRTINVPFPSLAEIQRKILDIYLSEVPIHPAAYAFIKQRSAIDHARMHIGAPELLKLDIKDFFSSISKQSVYEALTRYNFLPSDAHYISRLCCLDGYLPQGACTSPTLSNIIFKSLDHRLSKLATHLNITYSRYADDMVFSGRKVPRDLVELVSHIISDGGLSLNTKKTQLKLFGKKKIVTGISISTGTMKAPKEYKRSLRAAIYELEKNNWSLNKSLTLDPLCYERIIGKLNYLLQIEPNNEYALKKKALLSQQHKYFLSLSSDFSSLYLQK